VTTGNMEGAITHWFCFDQNFKLNKSPIKNNNHWHAHEVIALSYTQDGFSFFFSCSFCLNKFFNFSF